MKYDLDCIREVLLTLESNLKITVSENEKAHGALNTINSL